MIGIFPPPVMGMAMINDAMKSYLVHHGISPEVIDLSTGSISKAWLVRIRRLLRLPFQLAQLVSFLVRNREASVYLSLSGRYGQVFEMPFAFTARVLSSGLFLHHHNMTYIDRPWWLTRLFFKIAGKETQHIVLCECMAGKLQSSYKNIDSVISVSNTAFLDDIPPPAQLKKAPLVLGFLGNIEPDKGIIEFLDVVKRLEDMGEKCKALLAGPFRDDDIERFVRRRVSELNTIEYIGPVYGEDKKDFFASVDVLLYPTRNDAEPLTLIEAMGHGVPVIAWVRGCIREMLSSTGSVLFDGHKGFVDAAIHGLLSWKQNPAVFSDVSLASRKRYLHMRDNSYVGLKDLLSRMIERGAKI